MELESLRVLGGGLVAGTRGYLEPLTMSVADRALWLMVITRSVDDRVREVWQIKRGCFDNCTVY